MRPRVHRAESCLQAATAVIALREAAASQTRCSEQNRYVQLRFQPVLYKTEKPMDGPASPHLAPPKRAVNWASPDWKAPTKPASPA